MEHLETGFATEDTESTENIKKQIPIYRDIQDEQDKLSNKRLL